MSLQRPPSYTQRDGQDRRSGAAEPQGQGRSQPSGPQVCILASQLVCSHSRTRGRCTSLPPAWAAGSLGREPRFCHSELSDAGSCATRSAKRGTPVATSPVNRPHQHRMQHHQTPTTLPAGYAVTHARKPGLQMSHSWKSVCATRHLRGGVRGQCALCGKQESPQRPPHTVNQAQGDSSPHQTLDKSRRAALLEREHAKEARGSREILGHRSGQGRRVDTPDESQASPWLPACGPPWAARP